MVGDSKERFWDYQQLPVVALFYSFWFGWGCALSHLADHMMCYMKQSKSEDSNGIHVYILYAFVAVTGYI